LLDLIANPGAAIVLIFRQEIYLEKNQPQSSVIIAMHTTFYKSISIISGVFGDRSNNEYWLFG
jgi:hypothetical protein